MRNITENYYFCNGKNRKMSKTYNKTSPYLAHTESRFLSELVRMKKKCERSEKPDEFGCSIKIENDQSSNISSFIKHPIPLFILPTTHYSNLNLPYIEELRKLHLPLFKITSH